MSSQKSSVLLLFAKKKKRALRRLAEARLSDSNTPQPDFNSKSKRRYHALQLKFENEKLQSKDPKSS